MDGGLAVSIDALAASMSFSGVARADRDGRVELARAYGWADRANRIPNTVDTRFGLASGTKGFTALAVMSLVEDGTLSLGTTARSLLGPDLPLIDDTVTVEHLLAHRSGIGDYIDEDTDPELDDYLMPVPVHELADTEQYLRVLDGHPAKFRPGERFAYCNSGFVVLALLAERAAGVPFHDLVRERVCRPAGMADTEFLRSDEPVAGVAIGYLTPDGARTNVLHLPVHGSGDGGIHSTAADIHALWTALFAGRIVSAELVAEMTRPRSDAAEKGRRYGLGLWLAPSGPGVRLNGYDAGVSFRTEHDPATGVTRTLLSNTSTGVPDLAEGLWPTGAADA